MKDPGVFGRNLEISGNSQQLLKILTFRSKLESLCRELQKQNKAIKDESLSRIKEEETKRKETQEKFQKSLGEIQMMMNENTEKNDKLKQDNLEMSNKFKYILDQYEQREFQMDKINKQMELVTQLNEAKLAKAVSSFCSPMVLKILVSCSLFFNFQRVEAQAEKEKHLKETAILEETIKILKAQLADSVAAEKCLKEQVELYSGKYGEFQESLKKSHDVFEGYKTDMTKMSKKTLRAEKDVLVWKSKFEKCNALLLDLISEKQVKDEHITKSARQMFFVQKLCRQLQAERTAFFNALKEHSIEIPVVKDVPKEADVVPPVEFEEPPKEPPSDKLDVMTKNCDQLKKNLAQLQGKLEAIATTEVEKEKAPKKDKGKKKAKKDKKVDAEKQEELIQDNETKVEGPGNPESEINVEDSGNKEIAQEKPGNEIKEEKIEEKPENPEKLEENSVKIEAKEENSVQKPAPVANGLPTAPTENPPVSEAAT